MKRVLSIIKTNNAIWILSFEFWREYVDGKIIQYFSREKSSVI